jgi:hypothetical protein
VSGSRCPAATGPDRGVADRRRVLRHPRRLRRRSRRVTARGLQPAEFELIDRHCLQAVNEWKRAGFPDDAAALLLARTDLPEPAEPTGGAEAEAILAEFEAAGARDAVVSTDPVEAEAFLGGTVTGEHGVGLLKRAGMHRELGPGVLAMQRAVKAALDPHDILNPGKAVG